MDEIATIGLLATVLSILGAVITPMLKLNGLLTKLNANVEMLISDGSNRDHRLDTHSERLDTLETEVTKHGVEIVNIKHQCAVNLERGFEIGKRKT